MVNNALPAVSWSTMSQPVRRVMAPRLVAPRRNSRRDGSGRSLAASLIRSLGSTPGMTFRIFGIAPSCLEQLALLILEHDLVRKSTTFRDHAQRPIIIARKLFGTSMASAM